MEDDDHLAYPWQPLPRPSKDIRLLTLHPGHRDDEIKYSLEIVQLLHAPKYQALSYTWGDLSDRVPIYGHDSVSPIKPTHVTYVTRNLACALRDLRKENSEIKLWVDAICINQSNPVERNQQVNIMGMIYGKASLVWIWLGNNNLKIDLAMDIFAGGYERLGPIANEEIWAAFSEFFSRSWWSRIWVVQEVMYAGTVELICGKRRVSWESVNYVIKTYGELVCSKQPFTRLPDLCVDFQELEMFKRKYYEDPNREARPRDTMWRQPLQTLLWAFRYRQASEVKDKIYALLDLSLRPMPMQPDYTRSVADIYCQIAKHFMTDASSKGQNPLDILAVTHNIKTPRLVELRSWAPDWAAWEDTVSLGRVSHLQSTESLDFHANDNITRCEFWEYPEPLKGFIKQKTASIPDARENISILTINGVFLGALASVGMEFLDVDSSTIQEGSHVKSNVEILAMRLKSRKLMLSTLKQWVSLCPDCPIYAPTGESDQDACWKTIGVISGSTTSNKNYINTHVTSRPKFITSTPRPGWKFSISDRNHYAIVPNLAQENDVICITFGSSTPFLLRPVINTQDAAPGEQTYNLIGRCYVHGFMNGEAMQPVHALFEQTHRISKEEGIDAAIKHVDDGIQSFVLV